MSTTDAIALPPVSSAPPPHRPPPVSPPPAPPVALIVGESRGWFSRHVDNWLAFETSFLVHLALMLVLAMWTASAEPWRPVVLAMATVDAADPTPEVAFDASAMFQPAEPAGGSGEGPDAAAETEPSHADIERPLDWDAQLPALASDVLEPAELLAKGKGSADFGELVRLNRGGSGIGDGEGRDAYDRRLLQVRAQTGDVQVSLFWNNFNDLDLHVICPSGERILFSHNRSKCGGRLDIDMNVRPFHSRTPVENVFWPPGKAPLGRFVVLVDHYNNHGPRDPTEYLVRVKVDGKSQDFRGHITRGQPAAVVYEFVR